MCACVKQLEKGTKKRKHSRRKKANKEKRKWIKLKRVNHRETRILFGGQIKESR